MSLLSPTSIAVIGASSVEGKVGHDILKNLLTQGYGGTVFPVNVKGGEILGKKVFVSVKDIPDTVDLAIIVIPAAAVPQALTECGEKGIKNAVVISAGFTEVHTDDGKKLEEELVSIAKKYDIALIGPNCLGIVRPSSKMNASFAKELPPAGSVGFISQSGATAVALMDMAPLFGIGFSMMLSIGNKAVLDECETLEMLAADEETRVIGFYLESIRDGRKFRDIASRVAQTKPIVLLKDGISARGKIAASSHTGALAGSNGAIDALCAETGIHRAQTSEEFFDLLSVLSTQPQLQSNRIAVITNAGGPGILATDAAESAGVMLPELSTNVAAELRTKLPPAASVHNPIDVIGDASADRYEAALTACREDPTIDGIVVLLTPQVMTPCTQVAQTIIDVMKSAPLMPVVACFMGNGSVLEATELLRKNNIPVFSTPERAVRAMAALRESVRSDQRSAISHIKSHSTKAERCALFTDRSPGLLDEDTTAKLFALYDLPLPKQALAKSPEEAVTFAERIGYPVIMKVQSKDILHKTDIGGVRANLQSKDDVLRAWREIQSAVKTNAPNAIVDGLLVQQFLPAGDEFIVGSVRDPSFGPLVLAGLGGIYTELFRDSTMRMAPVSNKTAYDMLEQLKAWKLLLGMRGKAQADIDALASLIERVSVMVAENPQITELDLNPVLVTHEAVVIADAKVVIRQ
ncbi:MAG TPA: acetate--CoA ligase family protein [Candidatus Peribacteraceae bacterium]|nr:acetate--CoA ligase family protein [Candidatus Peribacteraceae bacterium]